MRRSALLVLVILLNQVIKGCVLCVRLVELRVPAHVAAGGEALLGCQFDMEGDLLYSLKWYKDGREFYRYVPTNKQPVLHFAQPGVHVDLSRSSSDVVTLVDLSEQSAGTYGCEVAGEAPLFSTVYDQKHITVYLVPEDGPRISGLQNQYKVGDRVLVNCTSSGSRPETHLKWLVNDQPVSRRHLQGPWYRSSIDRPNATETILQLRFTVKPEHFSQGVMKLKCQATIAPLYQKEAVHRAVDHRPSHYSSQDPELEWKEQLISTFKELDHFKHLEQPYITTYPPDGEENNSDHGTITEKSLKMLVIALLFLVILI